MIKVKRKSDGKEFEITEEDQRRVREIALQNGGDVMGAVAQQFKEKFGEEFDPCQSK
jgi:hypothetical protein